MPAKKKPVGGKKKKGGKDDAEDEPMNLEEQNVFLLRTIESLKHKLVMQTNKASGAEAVVRELRSRLYDLQKDYEEEKKRTFEIAADMTRQYKAMREELLKKITELQDQITGYEDELDLSKIAAEELKRTKDQQIALKESEIQEQKNNIDKMAHEFGEMLKETLDKMSQKIRITNDWEADKQDAPIVRTFEDFNLGLTNE